jgi:YesN/AraC family two-component response regulator
LWLVVLQYSWNFRPITVVNTEGAASLSKSTSPIAQGSLERVVEEQQLYLRPDLTLQELAQSLGTNRTYVSNYISQVMGQTFYDYINQLRIERSTLPLINEHPEYTFEYVARQSGFISMSTFRRAFKKITGQTPSQYVAMREQ